MSAVTLEVESFGHARLDTQVKSSRGIFDIIDRHNLAERYDLVALVELYARPTSLERHLRQRGATRPR